MKERIMTQEELLNYNNVFPWTAEDKKDVLLNPGISKREWMATYFMEALLRNYETELKNYDTDSFPLLEIAQTSIQAADLLLQELKEKE
jgi:hypothetical protein